MVETKETYNGWTNYETWAVKLWLDNDQGSQELQRELAQQATDAPKNEVWTRRETTRFGLADLLKEFVEENNPMSDVASIYSDLMTAALSRVNWQGIADSILKAEGR